MKYIYLYTNNHAKSNSVETFINWIHKDIKGIKDSNYIRPGSVNFLIENFQKKHVEEIKKNKIENNKTKIILLVTELFNSEVKIFNSFKLEGFLGRLYVILIYYFIEFLRKLNFKKKIKANLNKLKKINLKSNGFLDNLFIYFLELHSLKRRYNNYKKIEAYVDIFLYTHPDIKFYLPKNKKKFLYPYRIKYEKTKKIAMFGFSGKLTKYRHKEFIELSKKKFPIKFRKFINNILKQKKNFHDDYKRKISYQFKLHMKRDDNWPIISPVRIINSLNRREIPIICDYFKLSYLKNLCIYLKMIDYKSINKIILTKKKINKQINKEIYKFNKKSFDNLIKINSHIKNLATQNKTRI